MIERYVTPPRDLIVIDSDISNNDKKYKYGGADHKYCRTSKEKPDFKKLLDEKMKERSYDK